MERAVVRHKRVLSGCLGANAEVYDAEIIGLCGGLKAALSSPMAGLASGVHICKDNLIIAKEKLGPCQTALVRQHL